LADTIEAEALDDGAVDVDGATGAVGLVAGGDAKAGEVSGGDGLIGILVATALGNANAASNVGATSTDVLKFAVGVTAFAAEEVIASIVALLVERGGDHAISAVEVDAVGGGDGSSHGGRGRRGCGRAVAVAQADAHRCAGRPAGSDAGGDAHGVTGGDAHGAADGDAHCVTGGDADGSTLSDGDGA